MKQWRVLGAAAVLLGVVGSGFVQSGYAQETTPSAPSTEPFPADVVQPPQPDMPDVTPYLLTGPELMKLSDFRTAYLKAVGPLTRVDWIQRLSGTESATIVDFKGERYVHVVACNPNRCRRHYLNLLFHPKDQMIIGFVQDGTHRTTLGPRRHVAHEYFPKVAQR